MTSYRRLHRTRHIRKDINLSFKLRYVVCCDLHCILERIAHFLRDVCVRCRHRVSNHQLVRKHSGLRNLCLIAQTSRNDLNHFRVTKHSMTRECVEIHPSHLPWSTTSDLGPFLRSQFKSSQHLEWHVWNIAAIVHGSPLERFKAAHKLGQRFDVVVATDEVSKQRFAVCVPWLRVDHLHDVRLRGILTNVRLEQRNGITSIEPLTHHPLRRSTK